MESLFCQRRAPLENIHREMLVGLVVKRHLIHINNKASFTLEHSFFLRRSNCIRL
jgi:hypothetical protein